MPIELITFLILSCWVVLMVSLERVFPYKKNVQFFREGFWLDLVWYTIIQSFFLKILIFDMIIAPSEVALGVAETGYLSHWPIWALVVFFVLTHDFYIYWFHRLQHNSKLFWRTHEAHHSVEDVDWLAGSRSHAVEIIINQTIEFAPIFFLLDVKTAAIVVPIKALIDATWGMYIHSNIDVKSGRLQYIINGPEMHQWHHADHEEVFYKNYATKFAFFDWIFGTGYNPDIKPIKWGLPYKYPKDYFFQHIFSIKRFDVEKLEKNKWLQPYFNLRQEWSDKMLATVLKSKEDKESGSEIANNKNLKQRA